MQTRQRPAAHVHAGVTKCAGLGVQRFSHSWASGSWRSERAPARRERGGQEVALGLRALAEAGDDALDEAVVGIEHRARRIPRRGAGRNRLTSSPMDTAELRSLQAPLKQRYRDDPDAAIVTLKASGSLGEGISCSRRHRPGARRGRPAPRHRRRRLAAVLRRHAARGARRLRGRDAAGGRDLARRSTIDGGTVHAEGDLDFRGTLGVDKEAPVGFQDDPAAASSSRRTPARRSSPRSSS